MLLLSAVSSIHEVHEDVLQVRSIMRELLNRGGSSCRHELRQFGVSRDFIRYTHLQPRGPVSRQHVDVLNPRLMREALQCGLRVALKRKRVRVSVRDCRSSSIGGSDTSRPQFTMATVSLTRCTSLRMWML